MHAQRHTAATLLLDQGVVLAAVQEMLGHADIRVTRGYTHVLSPLTIEAPGGWVPCCGSSQLQPETIPGILSKRECPAHDPSRLSESNR